MILTTAGVPQVNKAALLRTMGHFLLSSLPDEGLTEALEGLAETYTYWKIRTQGLPETSRATSIFYDAVQGSSYVRPTFHVIEE